MRLERKNETVIMNRYGWALLATVFTPTVAAESSAHAIQTGEGLLKMCQGADRVKALSMMCHSYLNGYIDTAQHYSQGRRFCLGAGDKQRLPVVVVTWLNAHPAALKRPAPEALGKLLPENYPCLK